MNKSFFVLLTLLSTTSFLSAMDDQLETRDQQTVRQSKSPTFKIFPQTWTPKRCRAFLNEHSWKDAKAHAKLIKTILPTDDPAISQQIMEKAWDLTPAEMNKVGHLVSFLTQGQTDTIQNTIKATFFQNRIEDIRALTSHLTKDDITARTTSIFNNVYALLPRRLIADHVNITLRALSLSPDEITARATAISNSASMSLREHEAFASLVDKSLYFPADEITARFASYRTLPLTEMESSNAYILLKILGSELSTDELTTRTEVIARHRDLFPATADGHLVHNALNLPTSEIDARCNAYRTLFPTETTTSSYNLHNILSRILNSELSIDEITAQTEVISRHGDLFQTTNREYLIYRALDLPATDLHARFNACRTLFPLETTPPSDFMYCILSRILDSEISTDEITARTEVISRHGDILQTTAGPFVYMALNLPAPEIDTRCNAYRTLCPTDMDLSRGNILLKILGSELSTDEITARCEAYRTLLPIDMGLSRGNILLEILGSELSTDEITARCEAYRTLLPIDMGPWSGNNIYRVLNSKLSTDEITARTATISRHADLFRATADGGHLVYRALDLPAPEIDARALVISSHLDLFPATAERVLMRFCREIFDLTPGDFNFFVDWIDPHLATLPKGTLSERFELKEFIAVARTFETPDDCGLFYIKEENQTMFSDKGAFIFARDSKAAEDADLFSVDYTQAQRQGMFQLRLSGIQPKEIEKLRADIRLGMPETSGMTPSERKSHFQNKLRGSFPSERSFSPGEVDFLGSQTPNWKAWHSF